MKITQPVSLIPCFTGITNLYHLFYGHNIKECLVDKKCNSYVKGCFDMISNIKVDFNITEAIIPDYISGKDLASAGSVADVLLRSSLKPKYDLFVVHERNFEKMIPLMHRCVFIFVLDANALSKRFIPYTFVNDCFDGVLYMNDFHSMMFPSVRLTIQEQTYVRDKPFRFLKKEVELLHAITLSPQSSDKKGKKTVKSQEAKRTQKKKRPVIVEIGSCRNPVRHKLDEIDPVCCNDSHSTFFWAREPFKVHTVDVNPICKMVIEKAHVDGSLVINGALKPHTEDGIKFLEDYEIQKEGTVDFLFLDAWDVIPGTDYAEKHLEAFEKTKDKLSENCLLAIDDTDIALGGKGRKLIPELLESGWIPLYKGRHTVFYKGSLNKLYK